MLETYNRELKRLRKWEKEYDYLLITKDIIWSNKIYSGLSRIEFSLRFDHRLNSLYQKVNNYRRIFDNSHYLILDKKFKDFEDDFKKIEF